MASHSTLNDGSNSGLMLTLFQFSSKYQACILVDNHLNEIKTEFSQCA